MGKIDKKTGRSIAVVLGMGLLLAGCAGISGNTQDTGDRGGSLESTTEDLEYDYGYGPDGQFTGRDLIVVGVAQVGSESDWRITNTKSYRDVFTEENGYYLIFEDGQQKQENQVKALRNFILQEVDYIVLDPVVETGWDSVLLEAKEAGIPVILADRSVSVEDPSLYTCWIGSDFHAEGVRAGNWLERYLTKQGKKDAPVHIVTVQGTLDSTAQIGRTEGFAQVLKNHSNWTMLEYQSGDFTQARAREVMEEFLRKYDDIDVIISENDNMTFGVIDALEEAGYTLGTAGDVIILSFDAVSDALRAVQNGEIAADFECNPLLGPGVDEIIQKLERGDPVERINYVEESYFDATMNLQSILKEREY